MAGKQNSKVSNSGIFAIVAPISKKEKIMTEAQNEINEILELIEQEGIKHNPKIEDLFEAAIEDGRHIDGHNTYNDGVDLYNYYLIKKVTIGDRYFTMVEASVVGTGGGDPRFCAYEPIIAFETEDDESLYITGFTDELDGSFPEVGFVA